MSVISIMGTNCVPCVARCQVPQAERLTGYPWRVRKIEKAVRKVLAENVGKLMVRDGEK